MPDAVGRWCIAAAVATAAAVAVPASGALVAIVAVVATVRRAPGRLGVWLLVVLSVAGAVAGFAADARRQAVVAAELPEGRVRIRAVVREDPAPATGAMAVARPIALADVPWPGPPLGIGPLPEHVDAGDVLVVDGVLRVGPRRIRNDHVSGLVHVRRIVEVRDGGGAFFAIGNGIRQRVRAAFPERTPTDGLVTGLLIGDTERLPAVVMEDLRRSGLAHFVAVSGSNVALFLGAWWLVGAPLAIHPRLRAVFGILGLIVFVVVTRWEPSVIRAAVMAAVPLVGGVLSVPVDPWMALGTAVTILLLASADLLASVGFQLSVAATAGVLIGITAVAGRRPAWLWLPLGATVGAQALVAPIILVVFGSIPLLAPLANLVAAPVVTVTTIIAIGAVMIPLPLVADGARLGAGVVLDVAALASSGPQLGALGAMGAAAIAVAVVVRPLRPLGMAAVALVALGMGSSTAPWPVVPTLVALDIGQGDAILLLDPSGRAALVDGGDSPRGLARALARHGVDRLDLVVATHGDADHAGGLEELVLYGDVAEVWLPDHTTDPVIAQLEAHALGRGIPVARVGTGDTGAVGSIRIEVLGPGRRYLADNDGSVVILATASRSVLLPGDIESTAQRGLPNLRPDVMVVPHHGSGTTDERWLRRTIGPVAVLSYGENRFGHPHPDIVGLLEEVGTRVLHTHLLGDVVVPLG